MSAKYAEFSGLNLPGIEQEILAKWKAGEAFEKSISLREGRKPFVFYEGPPSANGMPGIHHVISRTLKDMVCRYKTMQGFQVKRKGGWDTHGLPIELGVEKELGITKEDIGKKISVEEYNSKCREAVLRYKKEWDDITTKMGYWVDLNNPYVTFENNYIETLWWILSELYKKGYLYESVSIQPYSPAAGTGLSSHELNQPGTYKDVKDTSVVAMFKVVKESLVNSHWYNSITPSSFHPSASTFFLAWTTTPWTLPSNLGLTVGSNIDYVLVKTFNPYTHLPVNVILAKALLGKYFKPEGENGDFGGYDEKAKILPWHILVTFKGIALAEMEYEQLLPYEANSLKAIQEITPTAKPFRIITGDFVTTEDGTGIVHTAPAFGADDYKVGKKFNIGILTMVDKQGKFVEGLGEFSNRYVKDYKDEPGYVDVNVDICVKLKKENRAFKVEKYEHSYPHCWRTDKPILYYPLDAWFIKTTAVKDRMVELNKTINWKPKSTGEGRFGNWLENMVDWNLSRSRYWGTPLPVWRTEDGSEEICVGSVGDLKRRIAAASEWYTSEERIELFDAEREVFLGYKAVDKVLTTEKDVEYAVCRKDISGGFIHFLWGEQGDESKEFKHGYGISKIIAKRKREGHEAKDILYKIVDTLVHGVINRKFGPEHNQRIELEFNNCVAFLSEYKADDKYTWLLTGFMRKNETGEIGEICDSNDSTQITPTRTQDNLGAVSEANVQYHFIQPIFRFKTDDLHKPFVDDIFFISKEGKIMQRVSDLIDVWFDSGAMPYAQWHYPFENKDLVDKGAAFPADFIAEGVDQTRGWFYTLHALAVMLFDSVAYKAVVSNGLVLDKNGNKMSKRLGNVVNPFETIEKYGADATRWYLITNASPWDNLKFDLAGIQEVQRKFFGTLYNTYQFFCLYANVDGFAFKEVYIPLEQRPEIDRWILSSLNTLVKQVTDSMNDFEPTLAGRAIEEFVDAQLSNWYVRLCRRRFWKGEYEADKISAYQTLYECLETITRLIAPISPFFSDAVFANLNAVTKRFDVASVHHADFPVYNAGAVDPLLEERMQLAQETCSLVLSLRKKVNIKVRQPLQKVMIPVLDAQMKMQLGKMEDLIKAEVNVKEIEYITETAGVIHKKIKANFKTLGAKLGAAMKEAAAAIGAFTQEQIIALELSGQATLALSSGNYTIDTSDVDITAEDIPGWSVANKGKLTIALDITLSEELKQEGEAREFVNRIQNIRKENGFELTDRIFVRLQEGTTLRSSIIKFNDYICREILADGIDWVAELKGGTEIEVNDIPLTVVVNKKSINLMATKKPAPKAVAKPASKSAPAKKAAAKPAPKVAAKPVAPAKKAPVKPVAKAVAKPAPKAAPAPVKAAAKAPVKSAPAKPVAKAPVKSAPAKPAAKASAPVVAAPAKPVAKAPTKPVAAPAPKVVAKPVAPAPAAKPAPTPAKPVVKAPPAPPVKPVKKVHGPIKDVKVPKISSKSSVPYNPGYTPLEKRVEAPKPQGPLVKYNDNDLNEFRELIGKKLEAAKKELSYLQGLITRKDEMGGDNDDARYMTMEDGTMSMEKEQLSQMASRQITYIDHLEKALMRIENKTYGICRVTGRLIDKARLRAVPHATLSLEAKLGLVKPSEQ